MKRIQAFIRTSIIGGILVILPMAIFFIVFRWLFNLVTDLIEPLSNLVMEKSILKGVLADLLVIVFIILVCFFVGVFVKTRIGKFIHENLENRILSIAPGYTWIKETVMQFIGKRERPFSDVVLVKPFANDTMMTGFVTDRHVNGMVTVFVPTGPNPTTGFIFHLERQQVLRINTSVETAMRSIISCGAGTDLFMNKMKRSDTNNNADNE